MPMDGEAGLSGIVIGAAIEVHRHLGPGLLESAYESCLSKELDLRDVSHKRQVPLPLEYKGLELDCGYRLDILVDDQLIIELKTVDKIHDIHKAQLLTYLKLTRYRLGLIINFNVPYLRDGIVRIIND